MRWVRSPDWHDATAQRLHRTLQAAMWQQPQLQEVWLVIGMPPAEVAWDQPAASLWPTLTRDASDAGKLEHLIRAVRDRVPAVAAELDQVLAARNLTTQWYVPLHRHLSVLIGPGSKRAVIDRDGLRRSVLRMLKDEYPVLAITGDPGSGKSYSRHLIQHILHDPSLSCDFVVIDVEEDWYDDVRAADLVSTLATRLDLGRLDPVDEHVEQSRAVRDLVHQFVGRFRRLPPRLRWLFIDGLDRPWVRPCVHLAVARLAKEIEAGQLQDTRLVVTGHPGDFSPDVLDVLLVESLDGITEKHLHDFFQEVATTVGAPLTADEVSSIVADVLTETDLSDLRAVGASVGRAAHARFAPKVTA
ncbi:effector-associated domain EAD1-containing protein [Saccharothrix luteola]|uniref:effector-associated domain EAD1-containing protein n=1 Tax=Saccharothrix luteola TaxID=2893018 RepID=UPI001E30E153|nr:effector-associated domain EAD1-containing protein [Saccharothrix luteola]MCC8247633.1 effector-associated domain EAD1-containing protein [Saccharothrix luteola]